MDIEAKTSKIYGEMEEPRCMVNTFKLGVDNICILGGNDNNYLD